MKIGINGFGRIGRAAFKIILERAAKGEDIEIVAINDLGDVENLAYLLKHDTVYGIYPHEVSSKGDKLLVDGVSYTVLSEKDPATLPWGELEIDVVLECTGVFTRTEDLKKHFDAGAKKVILSSPAKDDFTKTVVLGAEDVETGGEDIISNASCTTNCVTPIMRVLSQKFGVEKAMLTTVHAYTSTQSLVDGPAKKARRGRAAAQNIVPSSTGAAKATAKAMPQFESIFDGVALRVPVPSGSISDITALLKKNVTVEEVNQVLKDAENEEDLKGILKYTEDPIVSSDIVGSSYSAIVDSEMTRVVGGNLVKVMAWYDNEWGYSNRLIDMAQKMGREAVN